MKEDLDKYWRPDVKYPPLSDKIVWRPLAKPIARLCLKVNLTANQTSVLKCLVLCMAGLMYLLGGWSWFVVGGVLLVFAKALDFVDGMLARIKGTASEYGRKLENMTEDAGETVVILGLMAGLCRAYPQSLMVVMGLSAILFKLILGKMGEQKTQPKKTVLSAPLPMRVYLTANVIPILLLVTGLFNIIVVGFVLMCAYYGIRLSLEVMRRFS